MYRILFLVLISSWCCDTIAQKQIALVIVPHQNAHNGQLYKFEEIDATWHQIGPAHDISIGANGVAWPSTIDAPANAVIKKEGDKRSPAGRFALSQSFGRAAATQAKYILMPYQQIGANAQCIEDRSSSFYNQIVWDNSTVLPDWDQDDRMLRNDDLYDWGIFVEHNTEKTPGKGSCIFIHIWRGDGKPTAGCTAMSKKHLTQLVYWLDPVKNPELVLLTESDYQRLRGDWNLPTIK